MDEENKNLPVPEDPEGPEEAKEPEKLENIVYDWARSLAAAVVSVVLLFAFGVRLIGVSGPSMQDTLYAELSETIVKRIIAVGGQTVDIDFASGVVYVDGEALEEPYIKEPTYTTEGTEFPLTLAEDEVFIMGDNRNHSTDSRSYRLGPVKRGYIQGRAVFLLSPGETPDTGKRDWSRVGFID